MPSKPSYTYKQMMSVCYRVVNDLENFCISILATL